MTSFASLSALALSSTLLLLPTLAFAEDVVATPNPTASTNANVDSPALPAVSVYSPSGAFGDKGQIAISSDSGLSISHTSIGGSDVSTTNITLLPAVDYFVAHNISVGGFLGLEYEKTGPAHTTSFLIGPRVGYNLVLSNRISFWPKLGLAYTHSSTGNDAVGPIPATTTSGDHMAVNIFAPVMFHPVQHFFVGFGPALDADFTGDAKRTTIAARLTIGGWVGPWK